ncbi:uncharacterized protein ARMOST_06480 [Armillaria ostoyae]|uniref:Uncharacterized protein n=1 Tax=Armillaria ostoyae TaxID=47428 RepID=A0A284R332_ARMOS|nr:uncharacterized protein ARMOST_06480 [Armillaria ostoyae]
MVDIYSLDDDAWVLITNCLYHSYFNLDRFIPRGVLSLASVSCRLRRLYFSVALKKVSWRWYNPSLCIPRFLCGALHSTFRELDFSITQRRTVNPWHYDATLIYDAEGYMEAISELMSMTALSLYTLHTVQIRFHNFNHTPKLLLMGPWRTLIETIFLLPALESLELEAPWFAEDEAFPSLTLRHANLRRFIYRAPFLWSEEAIRTPDYGR